MTKPLSYKDSGVDIDEKNKTFSKISEFVSKKSSRVLNTMGAFASVIDINFPEYKEPLLVFKLEEPGTKQKLALQYGSLNSVAFDMINHLVNDIIVMGAKPLAVQDLIVCGKLKDEIITPLIKAMSEACKINECELVGGETSEQPGVVDEEIHILGASIIGVLDKCNLIDGQKIKSGDVLLAIPSNGLHTNGYSLARRLIKDYPEIVEEKIEGERFIDIVLKPHLTYLPALKEILTPNYFNGLAHITGGGIEGNLSRIIPDGICAEVDLGLVNVLPIFKFIKEKGKVEDSDMLRTFNLGVGLIAVVDKENIQKIQRILLEKDLKSYEIGEIKTSSNEQKVRFKNKLNF